MVARKKSIDFEQKLDQLETLVGDMEKGGLSLEDSLKSFEDGIKITRECQQALKDAELKVEMLTRDSDKPKNFEPETD
ncbi:MAG: exodeoxyribonuclease VII small subunit [Porticoccus sp.]|nr:exodeoxyribonuclease VII small subunit [Porticoccus sp.]